MELNIFLTQKCAVRFLGMIVLIMLLSSLTVAQIPYVYTAENTATGYAAPTLPTLANCPSIPMLPDPFLFADGSRSTAFSDWEHHRSDFKAMFENYEIGTKPSVDKASQVTASYSGSTLTIHITANGQTMTMTCAVSIPSGATAPYPVCIGMNSSYGSVTSSDFTSRGIVGITFSHDQVTTYNNPQNTDPFFKLYTTQNIDNTGQYAAWAWGVSRIIDGLEIVKAAGSFNADLSHICVTGCSYAGKMALFAGAFDERVALTIAQESGGGGATTWRYSKTQADGTVEGLAQTSNQWFKNSMFDFGGANVPKLPDDHHMLEAMCAPRALYHTGNTDYLWLSNMSCYVCGMATAKIYSDLGIADRFGFNIDGGHTHCAFPSDQESEVQYFLNKYIKAQTSLSQTYRTHPAAYDTINYAMWYSTWGGGTNVPVTGVSVSPTTVSINSGGTSQLTATVSPSNATNKSVTWSSSNTSVATVSSSGLVTGVAGGTATITVTTVDGAKTATSAVTITSVNVPVTGVSVSPTTVSINSGGTSQLTATVSPSNASNKSVIWSSSNSAAATVSSTGLVTGVAVGAATITVTTVDGAKTATSAITVTVAADININSGGSATGIFSADQYYSGGTAYTNTATIDMSQITSNPPPVAIFSTERYGAFSYTIPNRTAGSAQTVTLYFADTYVTASGQRVFNVSINGTTMLSNFDIYASAGGQNKAIARSWSTTANSSGQVVIQFSTVTQNPKVNGISVAGGGVAPILSVSPTSVSVAAAANSTGTFNITSNTSWTVTSGQTWLTVNPASGSNNATVTVTAQQNTGTARSATVTVSGTGVTSQTVTVTQAGTSATTINLLGSWVIGTTHAKETGTNRVLIFIAHAEYTASMNLNAVTYGGQAMTKVMEYNYNAASGWAYTAAYILIEAGVAAASTNTFAVTWSTAPGSVGYSSAFFANVNQTFSTGATGTGGSTSNPITTTSSLATNNGDMVILAATCGNAGSYTLNNSFIEGNDQTMASTATGVTGHKTATGVNETPSATYSSTINRQTIIGFVIKNSGMPKIGGEEMLNRVEQPKGFELGQNYPNPFNPTTMMSFGIPENSFVSLKVYNTLGVEMAELAGREYSAGRHSVTFDATRLSSGVYFYTIRAGKYSSTQKMILQK
jgi:uncharacterized protein YjdB